MMKAAKKTFENRALSPALEAAIVREEADVIAIETQFGAWPEFVRLALLRVWSFVECQAVFGEWKRSRGVGERSVERGRDIRNA